MLDVSGLIVIPSEPQYKKTEYKDGFALNFTVCSQDKNKKIHRYGASLFVKANELNEWEEKIKPGNVFYISHAKWEMREYNDNKYPIPQLKLDKYHINKLTTPFWLEQKKNE